MSMPVKMVKTVSQAFTTVMGIYGPVTVAYVQETDTWKRDFLSHQAMTEFAAAVERQAKSGELSADVTTVALMETPHQSANDMS
ncbi:hypothetical protein B0T18DRAFT_420148 [Schizothecium vesticola]|uniref:Uncharacterized protein n=1 Tax=Schizothecium vesticola TaxID=314040 RepID=A0AA40K0L0_9PEZI|nr:hypothetical protein B0T18DRAFT_420148 [Schizothecium vesticola]